MRWLLNSHVKLCGTSPAGFPRSMTTMKVSPLTLLLVILLPIARFGQSAVVQQTDEDKAISLVFELIGNLSVPPPPGLGPGMPPGRPPINNVCS